jgi:hypothetical protein
MHTPSPFESRDLEFADFNTEKSGSKRLYPAPTSDTSAETENAPDLNGRGHSSNLEHETRFEFIGLAEPDEMSA